MTDEHELIVRRRLTPFDGRLYQVAIALICLLMLFAIPAASSRSRVALIALTAAYLLMQVDLTVTRNRPMVQLGRAGIRVSRGPLFHRGGKLAWPNVARVSTSRVGIHLAPDTGRAITIPLNIVDIDPAALFQAIVAHAEHAVIEGNIPK